MKKDYQKPELEMVSLISMEVIASDDGFIDGSTGLEDSYKDW